VRRCEEGPQRSFGDGRVVGNDLESRRNPEIVAIAGFYVMALDARPLSDRPACPRVALSMGRRRRNKAQGRYCQN
jgi:hypothetical protein